MVSRPCFSVPVPSLRQFHSSHPDVIWQEKYRASRVHKACKNKFCVFQKIPAQTYRAATSIQNGRPSRMNVPSRSPASRHHPGELASLILVVLPRWTSNSNFRPVQTFLLRKKTKHERQTAIIAAEPGSGTALRFILATKPS